MALVHRQRRQFYHNQEGFRFGNNLYNQEGMQISIGAILGLNQVNFNKQEAQKIFASQELAMENKKDYGYLIGLIVSLLTFLGFIKTIVEKNNDDNNDDTTTNNNNNSTTEKATTNTGTLTVEEETICDEDTLNEKIGNNTMYIIQNNKVVGEITVEQLVEKFNAVKENGTTENTITISIKTCDGTEEVTIDLKNEAALLASYKTLAADEDNALAQAIVASINVDEITTNVTVTSKGDNEYNILVNNSDGKEVNKITVTNLTDESTIKSQLTEAGITSDEAAKIQNAILDAKDGESGHIQNGNNVIFYTKETENSSYETEKITIVTETKEAKDENGDIYKSKIVTTTEINKEGGRVETKEEEYSIEDKNHLKTVCITKTDRWGTSTITQGNASTSTEVSNKISAINGDLNDNTEMKLNETITTVTETKEIEDENGDTYKSKIVDTTTETKKGVVVTTEKTKDETYTENTNGKETSYNIATSKDSTKTSSGDGEVLNNFKKEKEAIVDLNKSYGTVVRNTNNVRNGIESTYYEDGTIKDIEKTTTNGITTEKVTITNPDGSTITQTNIKDSGSNILSSEITENKIKVSILNTETKSYNDPAELSEKISETTGIKKETIAYYIKNNLTEKNTIPIPTTNVPTTNVPINGNTGNSTQDVNKEIKITP